MRALLYGSGAVGLGLAASLLDCSLEVDMIAAGKTKKRIQENGIKRKGLFKEIEIPADRIKVFENLGDIDGIKYDYILIATKAITNEENAEDLWKHKHIVKDEGKLVIFQNGWGTEEPYLKYFDKTRVYNGRVITGFARPERNISEVTVHASPVLIGSLYGMDIEPVRPLAESINKGGIPCEVTKEIQEALWAKMLYNCTLNPLGAVLNVCYGKLTESKNSVFIMDRIIEEIFSVMQAAGYKTYWKTAEEYKKTFYEQLIPPTYSHRSSTLQDIERKIRTEIDTLNGSVVRLGEKLGVQVPYNTMIYNLIKAMESNF